MKYQSAYIMLTNFLQRDINILTIWKKVGFQMLFKKRGGCHFSNAVGCCSMLSVLLLQNDWQKNYNLNAGFVV